ncbi:MAG: SLC13/DASS family transporter [Bacteroidales bacterium]|nr:SLC13/DASS family transporter [Bacteroidales bacterium]
MTAIRSKNKTRFLSGLIGGLSAFVFVAVFVKLDPERPESTFTLATAVLMAIWWIAEVVPLAVTALLPVVLFPLFGILDGKSVSSAYFNDVIFLFLGGFLVALAMQKWNLHKRIALRILLFTGVSPGRILFGFMLATAFLSMWISNTATAMMMIPIVISVIDQLEKQLGKKQSNRYSIGLLLGIAYSASIGGIATLVGTPPNLAFARIYAITFPDAPEITFGQWMVFALPLSVLFLLFTWFYLYKIFCKNLKYSGRTYQNELREQYAETGKMGSEEKTVMSGFVLFALLLLFRSDIHLGSFVIPGWADIFSNPKYINDGTVAILIGILFFLIPARRGSDFILDWQTAQQIPWRIILLFGGGFALADGFTKSGLSAWIGESMGGFGALHPLIIILLISTIMIFLTEVTSNTATAQMILPIVAALSVSVNVHPLLFMLPVTIAGSMAFMLPVATPPNAIIFGTDKVRILDMSKTGFVLNLVGIIFITLAIWFYGRFVFGIEGWELPTWAIY